MCWGPLVKGCRRGFWEGPLLKRHLLLQGRIKLHNQGTCSQPWGSSVEILVSSTHSSHTGVDFDTSFEHITLLPVTLRGSLSPSRVNPKFVAQSTGPFMTWASLVLVLVPSACSSLNLPGYFTSLYPCSPSFLFCYLVSTYFF